MKEYIRETAGSYFISVTLINVAVFVTGSIFRPDERFGYDAMLTPLVYGAFTMLPTLIMYSKKELTIKQTLCRKAVQLLMDIVIIIAVVFGGQELTRENVLAAVAVAASIAVVFVVVHLIEWLFAEKTARVLTEQLGEFQKRNSEIGG